MRLPDLTVPIGDPLHIWKNLRCRLQAHPIFMYPEQAVEASAQRASNTLNLGSVLDDTTSTGKMRDSYALQLFTFENVVKLLKAGDYSNAALLMPFACWTAVVYSTAIDINFRLFLTELAFSMIEGWQKLVPELKDRKVFQKSTQNSEAVTVAEDQYLMRMLNTLAATGVALKFGSSRIRMDAIGTHLVENLIGIARQASSDPRWERIMSTYSHAEIRKRIARKYGLILHVSGRIGDGGCKFDGDDESEDDEITTPANWNVAWIMQLFRGICNPGFAAGLMEDLASFTKQLEGVMSATDRHQYDVNETANSGIIARLISFKAEVV